jgi:hypothetical protein
VDAWSAVIHQGYGGPRSAITATYAGFDIDLAVFGNHIFDQMRDRASILHLIRCFSGYTTSIRGRAPMNQAPTNAACVWLTVNLPPSVVSKDLDYGLIQWDAPSTRQCRNQLSGSSVK